MANGYNNPGYYNQVTNQWGGGYPQQYQPQNYVNSPPPSVSFALIEGESAVGNYLVGTNVKAVLIDFTNMKLYIKERDASNIPLPLRSFDIREVLNAQPNTAPVAVQSTPAENIQSNQNNYVTTEQFNELKQMIASMVQSNPRPNPPRNKHKEGAE